MKIEDAFTFTKEVRDEGKGYQMANDGSTEKEVGEFLFGLVKLLKPFHVLETGLYKGLSSSYMGLALQENGFGKLDGVEFEKTHIEECKEKWNILGLNEIVTPYLSSSLDFLPSCRYQMMFLDTELNLRFHELTRLFPYLDVGGYVVIHDMPDTCCQGNINPDHPDMKHWPVGEIPQQIKDWVNNGQLRPMFFPNPRGMMMLYKVKPDEYKWI